MEHEAQPQQFEPGLEPDRSVELEIPVTIEALPEALGFIETEELGQLRRELVEAMAAGAENVTDLATRYHLLAEEVVNQREGGDFAKAQIGLIVQMGVIRRDGGRNDAYLYDLNDAHTYAFNMGFDDIVPTIEAAIDQAQPETDKGAEVPEPTSEQLAQACTEVLTPKDCEELSAMPMDEALGYAFTLLIENGVDDPESYLRERNILE